MGEGASEASFLYLDTVGDVERFTSEISATREIALDTEGASFHRFVDRIYLLQLSTRQQTNTSETAKARHQIARIRTLQRERQLAEAFGQGAGR